MSVLAGDISLFYSDQSGKKRRLEPFAAPVDMLRVALNEQAVHVNSCWPRDEGPNDQHDVNAKSLRVYSQDFATITEVDRLFPPPKQRIRGKRKRLDSCAASGAYPT